MTRSTLMLPQNLSQENLLCVLLAQKLLVPRFRLTDDTVHGSEIRHPPVEVGSLFHYLWDFYASPVVVSRGMSHQRRIISQLT